jgi:hypothetical protein
MAQTDLKKLRPEQSQPILKCISMKTLTPEKSFTMKEGMIYD